MDDQQTSIINQSQEQMLLYKVNAVQSKALNKRLKILTLFNIMTFCAIFLAMILDRWVWISLIFNKNKLNKIEINFWSNLVFMKEDGSDQFQTFIEVQQRICASNYSCSSIFYSLHFVGIVSLVIVISGAMLQVLDFLRMLFYIRNNTKLLESAHSFRHIVTILTYIIGVTLSAFAFIVLEIQSTKKLLVQTEQIHIVFGVCFWVTVGTLILFICVLCYEQHSFHKVKKRILIAKLIDQQKNISRRQIMGEDNFSDYLSDKEDGSKQKIGL